MSGSERVSPMNQAAHTASAVALEAGDHAGREFGALDDEHQLGLVLQHRLAEPVLGAAAAPAGEQALLLLEVAGRDHAAEPLEGPLPQPGMSGGIVLHIDEQHAGAGVRTAHARMSPEATGMAGSTSSRNWSSYRRR